jgi:hypothetical protein
VFAAVATVSGLFLGCVGVIVFGQSGRREGIALGGERGARGDLGVLDSASASQSSANFVAGSVPTTQPDETMSAGPRNQPLLSLFMKGNTVKENLQRFNTRAFLDTCEVRPQSNEFCVYVNTNDYYYRLSDLMDDALTEFPMSKVMSDDLYAGTILRTLQSDPAFGQADGEERFGMFLEEVRSRECEVYDDDTLLLHLRSGDSGWIARGMLGEGEDEDRSRVATKNASPRASGTEGKSRARASVETVDRAVEDLGIVDAKSIDDILGYLAQFPSIRRVIMRTTLHFGVPEEEDRGSVDPVKYQFLIDNYRVSDASLWGSNFMLHDVYSALTLAGYETWVTSHSSADQDACEYAKACHFLSPDGRGFSQLMTRLNQNLAQC